jgi:hypothetical protein
MHGKTFADMLSEAAQGTWVAAHDGGALFTNRSNSALQTLRLLAGGTSGRVHLQHDGDDHARNLGIRQTQTLTHTHTHTHKVQSRSELKR